MTENPRTSPGPYHDDVQNHGIRLSNSNETVDVDDDVDRHGFQSNANETAEGGDTEGHGVRHADAESSEWGDTKAHCMRGRADAESSEDDVEGHIYVEERDELNGQRLR